MNVQSLIVLLLFLGRGYLSAQFIGRNSFENDTFYQDMMKKGKVASATETYAEPGINEFNGKYFFDAQGRVIVFRAMAQNGMQQIKYIYKGKNLIRSEAYNDTMGSLRSWNVYTYDAKNRVIKALQGQMDNGKRVEHTLFENWYVLDELGKRKINSSKYKNGVLEEYTEGFDSLVGIDTFFVIYRYKSMDKKNGSFAKKVSVVQRKGNIFYKHEFSYLKHGTPNAVNYIESYYYEYDDKKRLLELSLLKFENVRTKYNKYDPKAYNRPNDYPDSLIIKILRGEELGKKELQEKNVYDAKGRLIERKDSDFITKFTYNEKNQQTGVEQNRYAHSIFTNLMKEMQYKSYSQSLS
ncbi:MAG: hypothetical protein IT236_05045 [Bacteroidia bacterium]|nr:hypothetical protein [Bacteroidia bacterium]